MWGFVRGGCRLVLDFSPPALLGPHEEPRDRGGPSSGCQQGHLLTEFISIPGREGDLPPTIRDSETSRGCARTCAGSTGAQLQPQLRTEATSTRTPPDCSPLSVPTCRRSPGAGRMLLAAPALATLVLSLRESPPASGLRSPGSAISSRGSARGALASPQQAPLQGPAFTKPC